MAKAAPAPARNYQWELLQNSPVANSRTDDIWFFDELTGWLVNSSGYVCRTEDGGSNWTPKFFLAPNLPSFPYLRCMSWANRKIGWFGADRKSTRLNSSHDQISYAVFCLKKKK